MNRARYQKYISWYSKLPDQERSRLDNVCNNILSMVPQCLEDLNGETLIRRRADMSESSQDFYREELKRAVSQAMKLPLGDQKELYTLFDFILYEIGSGEINLSELYPIPGGNINAPKEPLGPKSYKWIESTVEVLSYLLYAVQIKAIFEGTRRESEPPKETSNEILYLLTRQVIISVGGMEECLYGKLRNDPKGKELSLSDVLVDKTSPEEVKELYKKFLNGEKPKAADIAKFLRHLSDKGYYSSKGYYSGKLIDRDYQAIGNNDFKPGFKIWRTNPYMPPKEGDEAWNHPPYTNIPDLR